LIHVFFFAENLKNKVSDKSKEQDNTFDKSHSSVEQQFNLRKSDEQKLAKKKNKIPNVNDSMESYFKSDNLQSELGLSKKESLKVKESNVINKFRTDDRTKYTPKLKSTIPIVEEEEEKSSKRKNKFSKKGYQEENMDDSMLASLNETGNIKSKNDKSKDKNPKPSQSNYDKKSKVNNGKGSTPTIIRAKKDNIMNISKDESISDSVLDKKTLADSNYDSKHDKKSRVTNKSKEKSKI